MIYRYYDFMISGSNIFENFVKLLSVQPEPPPPDLVLQVEVVPEESRLPETIDTSTTTFSTTSTTTIATTTAGSIPRFYQVVLLISSFNIIIFHSQDLLSRNVLSKVPALKTVTSHTGIDRWSDCICPDGG